MEWIGYTLIFGLIFIFFIVVFSDQRDRRGRYRSRRSDYWDDDDDYYPPHYGYWPPPYPYGYRRRRGFGGVLIGFFLGILVFAGVAGGVAGIFGSKKVPPKPQPLPSPIPTTHPLDYNNVVEKPRPAPPPKPPKRKLEHQQDDRMMKLAITDLVSLRQIQQTYPDRRIEGYRDDSTGQIWAVIFGTSESLDDIGFVMKKREEDLISRGLVFTNTVYGTHQVCKGTIVREEGTTIWFCDDNN